MKAISLQYEDTVMVGKHKDILIITIHCVPTEVISKFKYTLTVKAKRFNRKKINKGEIEFAGLVDTIQQVRDHISKDGLVEGMKSKVVASMLKDFPSYFPHFD